ncbi:MAG: Trehalose/maltose import ATP-binding protein MalK [Methanosaeta sp. PtaU1.Bin060]|jgi:peptide/nickel transport system ATP-binding protein|nr:MAG: Trehalose/maltose import ATP-binding protein MalK [Methanosaeta sp. PtaU1.Bin060]
MLELIEVSKSFRMGLFGRNRKVAVQDVSFSIKEGEILGLVGESGCGKSTLARIALKLIDPTSGRIVLNGTDVTDMQEKEFRVHRKQIQIVFQHPEGALDPHYTLMASIAESFNKLKIPKGDRKAFLERLADEINLPLEILDRYPNQVSGGEIQRAVLARIFAFQPKYLILDEPTSMLDLSVQASILQLLKIKAKQDRMGMLFISHDLEAVRAICDHVMVMKDGKILEEGPVERVFESPGTPYMRMLISSI